MQTFSPIIGFMVEIVNFHEVGDIFIFDMSLIIWWKIWSKKTFGVGMADITKFII